MKKAKLLLVADTYYPKVDGTLRFMEEFVKRSREDFEISLLVPRIEKHAGAIPAGVRQIIFLEPSERISLSGYPIMKFTLKNFRLLRQAIRDAELVFIQGPGLISYLATRWAKKYGKKTITYIHVLTWELFGKFLPPVLEPILFPLMKHFFFSMYQKNDLILVPYLQLKLKLEQEGIHARIAVAKLGVDINRFAPSMKKELAKKALGLEEKNIVIGYVGRISREKNINILLNAFKKLTPREELTLLLVGNGPEEQKRACAQLPHCQITGFVNNVEKYLQAMDIFVMPSLTETTSLATLEAMACGLPVVVTKVGFIPEYVKKEVNGIFFPKNNSSLLALKLAKLIDEPQLREQLGKQARKTVAVAFSWERSINKIKRLLMREYLN